MLLIIMVEATMDPIVPSPDLKDLNYVIVGSLGLFTEPLCNPSGADEDAISYMVRFWRRLDDQKKGTRYPYANDDSKRKSFSGTI